MDADQTAATLEELSEKISAMRQRVGEVESARSREKSRKEGWMTFALLLVFVQLSHCGYNSRRDKAELGLMSIMEEARGELKKVIREVERMPAAQAARDELVEDLEEVDFILNMERFADE